MLNESAPYEISQLGVIAGFVSREILAHRIDRLVRQAIDAGRFATEEEVAKAAGLSPQWLAELRIRTERRLAEKKPEPTVRHTTAEGLARALGISVAELTGGATAEDPTLPVDVYPARAKAVRAAKDLGYPEAAIQVVLREQRNDDPPPIYWFRRIEAESERIRPSSDLPRRDR